MTSLNLLQLYIEQTLNNSIEKKVVKFFIHNVSQKNGNARHSIGKEFYTQSNVLIPKKLRQNKELCFIVFHKRTFF